MFHKGSRRFYAKANNGCKLPWGIPPPSSILETMEGNYDHMYSSNLEEHAQDKAYESRLIEAKKEQAIQEAIQAKKRKQEEEEYKKRRAAEIEEQKAKAAEEAKHPKPYTMESVPTDYILDEPMDLEEACAGSVSLTKEKAEELAAIQKEKDIKARELRAQTREPLGGKILYYTQIKKKENGIPTPK